MGLCMGCMENSEMSENVCPACGYVQGTPPREIYHMQPGTIVNGRYVVGRVLGYGGFGVTYIGKDTQLDRKVALKEYLPGDFSTRMPGETRLTVYAGEATEQFTSGLERFVEEARRLAQFNRVPGVVDIYDTFKENNTGYIVMQFLDGYTIKELLKANGKLDVEMARELVMSILYTLKEVHKEGIIHRDISPDNIFITKDNEIKLLDFGAARYATTLHSKSLSVILKPGYAPEEQYRTRGNQGAWSDIYALAASFYKMVTGITPSEAMERAMNDDLVEPSKLGIQIPQNVENAILNAMNVKIEDRTQSADDFIADLVSDEVERKKVKTKNRIEEIFPMWLRMLTASLGGLIALTILLVATGVINIKVIGQTIWPQAEFFNVPNIVNRLTTEAESELKAVSLELSIEGGEFSTRIPKDKIMTQTPFAGRTVAIGDVISVTVSYGGELSIVPSLTDKLIDSAIEELKTMGYRERLVEEYNDDYPPGVVYQQSVAAGESLGKGEFIDVYVSKGMQDAGDSVEVSVPNVTGYTVEEGKKKLKEHKLYLIKSGEEFSDTVPKDVIMTQTHEVGTPIMTNEVIYVVVSKGQETAIVPMVEKMQRNVATSNLQSAKLKYSVTERYDNNVREGLVISQSIAYNTVVPVGTEVAIVVSRGREGSTQTQESTRTTNQSSNQTASQTQPNVPAQQQTPFQPQTPSRPETPVQQPPSNEGATRTTEPEPAPKVPEPAPKAPEPPKTVDVSNVKISRSSLSLQVGDNASLSAEVVPSNATSKSVSWSSNSDVVGVVNGRVTANRVGTAIVTVSAGGKSSSCTVTVTEARPAAPTASRSSGKFSERFKLELYSNYDIYYTINGSDPSRGSTKYNRATGIPIGATTTVKAIAVNNGVDSSVATFSYEFEMAEVKIPSFAGKSEKEARSIVSSMDLSPSVSYENSEIVPKGSLIEQFPSANSVAKNQYVHLVYSDGPAP